MPWSSSVPFYINDLPWAFKFSTVSMYADDTSLARSAKDIKGITCAVNTELENLKYGRMITSYL